MKLIATIALWLALVGGLGPATAFLVTFRPSWPPRSPAYAFSVIVGIVWILYLRVVLLLAIRGWVPRFTTWTEVTISIGLTVVCDVGLIYLLVQFWRFKATWKDHMKDIR